MSKHTAQIKTWLTEHKKHILCVLALLIIVFAVVGPVPFGAKTARAAGSSCIPVPGLFSLNGCAASLGWTVMKVVSWALGLAGIFFEKAVAYSINMDQSALDVVEGGWTVGRDVANMFFIFLTLYIGIATILQLSTYSLKSLLVTVIIIALLVNFSLVFTKVIIDASNMLALEFYSKLTTIKSSACPDPECESIGLSAALVSGMEPQKLFNMDLGVEENISINGGVEPTLFQIFVITIMGSFLIASAAFVLFAAGVLFIARTASLWIIMMLSSLAFVAMAVPKLKTYADKWWGELFNQAFFAPAFMFLYYLVIKIVVSGNILKGLADSNIAVPPTGMGIINDGTVTLIINFVVLIFLMFACLKIAKDMGAVGASTMQAWGGAMQDWGIGKVKSYGTAIGMAPIRGAALGIRRGVGAIEETAAGKRFKSGYQNLAVKTAKLPLIGTALSGAMLRGYGKVKDVGIDEKAVELQAGTGMKLRPDLRAQYMANASVEVRKKMWKDMTDRGRVEMEEEASKLGGVGSSAYDAVAKLKSDLPKEDQEKFQKAKITLGKHREEQDRLIAVENFSTMDSATVAPDILLANAKKIKASEAEDVLLDVFKNVGIHAGKLDAMIKSFGSEHMTNLAKRTDNADELFFDKLYKMYAAAATIPAGTKADISDVSEFLKDKGYGVENHRLASWVSTPLGQSALRGTGLFK